MESDGSLPFSQQPVTGTYPEPDAPTPQLTPYPKIHSNIILPFTPRSYERSLLCRDSDENFVYIFHLSHACHIPHPSHTPWLDHPHNIWWSVKGMKLLITQCSPASLLGRNILFGFLYSNTLNLSYSCSVTDQVSHPYKTGKIKKNIKA
jgi:hypothetical protein